MQSILEISKIDRNQESPKQDKRKKYLRKIIEDEVRNSTCSRRSMRQKSSKKSVI